jgi:hypothetical protein
MTMAGNVIAGLAMPSFHEVTTVAKFKAYPHQCFDKLDREQVLVPLEFLTYEFLIIIFQFNRFRT